MWTVAFSGGSFVATGSGPLPLIAGREPAQAIHAGYRRSMTNRAGFDTAGVPLLILWDVDHTLIENGGISKAVYRRAFEILTGRAPTYAAETDGRTDPLIMRRLLDRHGVEVEPGLLSRAMDVLPEALSSLVPQLREVGYPLPGAHDALAALREQPDVIQSVLTGNVKTTPT